jgi:SSS family solute:Na+ symporter
MIDLIIVLCFIAYAIYSGFSAKDEAGKDLKEYFLAGKTLSGWQAGFSMAATQFAADTPLLVTGLIATGGVFMLWRLWIYGISFILIGFIFATKWRRADVITDAELTEIRYSGKGKTTLRFLKAFYYGTIINCVVLAMVLVAAMRISEVFLPWHEWLPSGVYGFFFDIIKNFDLDLVKSITGLDNYTATTNNLLSIGIVVSFTTLYSTTGGLRSVVKTDMAQFIMAMLGTLIYAIYVANKAGGLSVISEKVSELYGDKGVELMHFFPKEELALSFVALVSIQWLFQMNSDGTGYLAQRSMACRSDREARIAAVIFAFAQVVVRSLIWLVIGVGILIVYPFELGNMGADTFTASREVLFITGIRDLLPPGVKGIMLVGLLGALASTIDTHLNWGASYWSNDIYQDLICKHWLKREPKTSELVWVARLSNILILITGLIIMFNLGSIKMAWSISLLFGAGMGSVLVLRWLWERINLYSEMAAIASSIIFAPIILSTVTEEWMQLVIMALVSTIACVGITFVTPKTDESILLTFYTKVMPQGMWPKMAKLAGDEPMLPTKKFVASLKEVSLIIISMYMMLIGIGKLILLTPADNAWIYIAIALVGVGLVPVWWRKV